MIDRARTGAATARFQASRAGVEAEGLDAAARILEQEDFEPGYLGWEIARCAEALGPDEQRALAALAGACVAAARAGSTRVPCDGGTFAAALAAVGGEGSREVAARLLARARSADASDPVVAVVGRPGDRKPLVVDGAWLYTERMHALEARFCARVIDRAARAIESDPRAVGRAVAAVASGPRALTEEQRRAVRAAYGASLSLVTGGPGSGKTATAVALLRALAWAGVPMDAVAVAAPTGKAAQRLSDAIHRGLGAAEPATLLGLADPARGASALVPQTLHRLLGWSPSRGRFARHEGDPLPYRVVIVDEASMVDLATMDRLLRALRPDARLALFGDADQLPSIDAGAVFRDLCAALGAARLTANLRVADEAGPRHIVEAARAVNAGAIGADLETSITTRRAAGDLAFDGVELLAAPWSEAGAAFLERWWAARFAGGADLARLASRAYRLRGGALDDDDRADVTALFDLYARSRILCATRVRGFASGAESINDRLLARLRAIAPVRDEIRWALAHGAPVVVQRNDYERGLYNGDQGIVLRVDASMGRGPEPMVVFPRGGGLEALPLDAAGDVAPAFAMTVHKAQGSEFDHVALVLPAADLPLLTRELVYTAITRARRSVVVIGQPDLLARAVSRVMVRESGVAEKLGTALNVP